MKITNIWKTHKLERSITQSLISFERSRIHDLITDPQTAHDPVSRAQNVKDALGVFLSHQLWEKAHPDKMWDEKGSTFPD